MPAIRTRPHPSPPVLAASAAIAPVFAAVLAVVLALVLVLVPAAPVAEAQPVREGTPATEAPTPDVPLTQLLLDGWTMVAPHVLERHRDGHKEILALGADGLEWEASLLEETATRLELRYQVTGDQELLDDARELREEAARTREIAAEHRGDDGDPGGISAEALASCTLTTTYSADAYPTLCGPRADASASFSDTCGSFADVRVETYAEGFLGGTFSYGGVNDTDDGNGSASVSQTSSVTADNDCYSRAYARVRLYDGLGGVAAYILEEENTTCRETLTVGIKGDTSYFVPVGSCVAGSWVADPSHPVSSHTWTWNNAVVGSQSSYARLFCWSSALSGSSVSARLGLSVTATCQSAAASRTIRIIYE